MGEDEKKGGEAEVSSLGTMVVVVPTTDYVPNKTDARYGGFSFTET